MASPQRVFLSYRRDDSAVMTGRLHDALSRALGRRRVFRDLGSIEGGQAVERSIAAALRRGTVVVAVVGRAWEGPRPNGSRRIDEPRDWVRFELETAFAKGLLTVPVLVDGRGPLAPANVPPSLAALVDLQALPLRDDPDFKPDVARLLRAMGYRWWRSRSTLAAAALAPALAVGIVGGVRWEALREWNAVMVANYEQGQWDPANAAADGILRYDPNHVRALTVKGNVAALSGEFRTAVGYFLRAYQLAPDNRAVQRNLAYAYLHSGRVADAIALYERLRDGSAAAEYSVACAYLAGGRYADVLTVVAALPKVQPAPNGSSPPGQVPLLQAAALMGVGNDAARAEAVEKLKFAVSRDPDYWVPILAGEERDPENDYDQQVALIHPILDAARVGTAASGGESRAAEATDPAYRRRLRPRRL